MKKIDFNSNQDFEKLLKEKMNELSTSVDCFDKISARAFPEKDSDFSDCGLTVSDLENVTGRHRVFPVLKWVSAAAAIVLCIGIIPKTALINSLRNSMENCQKNEYNDIIKEIQKETKTGSYYICDFTLDEYISRDVLVTPLYSCPFEESDDNMNVRIFVKTINGLRTNQIYAVEYHDVYSEDNIVAAAETGVKFSQKETAALEKDINYFFTSDNEPAKAVATAFSNSDGTLGDVSAASFSDLSFYKSGKKVSAVQTDVIYYRYNDSDDYFYDIKTIDNTGSEIAIPRDSWKKIAYSDDEYIANIKKTSAMTKTDLFTGSYSVTDEIWFFTPEGSFLPYNTENIPLTSDYIIEQHNSYDFTGNILSQIAFPKDSAFQHNLNIYLGQIKPVGVYPEHQKDNAQYYSTLSMTSIFNSTQSKNNLENKISDLSSDLLILNTEEQNRNLNEDEKAAYEIERQRIQQEMNRLNEYQLFLQEKDESNHQRQEAEEKYRLQQKAEDTRLEIEQKIIQGNVAYSTEE